MQRYKGFFKKGEINELIILGPDYWFQSEALINTLGYTYIGECKAKTDGLAKNIFIMRLKNAGHLS